MRDGGSGGGVVGGKSETRTRGSAALPPCETSCERRLQALTCTQRRAEPSRERPAPHRRGRRGHTALLGRRIRAGSVRVSLATSTDFWQPSTPAAARSFVHALLAWKREKPGAGGGRRGKANPRGPGSRAGGGRRGGQDGRRGRGAGSQEAGRGERRSGARVPFWRLSSFHLQPRLAARQFPLHNRGAGGSAAAGGGRGRWGGARAAPGARGGGRAAIEGGPNARFQAAGRIIGRFAQIPAWGARSNRGLVAISFD